MFDLTESIVELYRLTANVLPFDVSHALHNAQKKEKGIALLALNKILENCRIARENSLPLCQDTGTPVFFVFYNKNFSQKEISVAINNATVSVSKKFLRSNAIDSISDKNLGTNFPEINFIEWEEDFLRIDLMLKGGGSENASVQYSIPCEITSERSLAGVKKIVLTHLVNLQGKACPPGVLGICIGGTRADSLNQAQRQLFRKINDVNKDLVIAGFEKDLLKDANFLGIGPMGFGGKTTLFGVKACAFARHPASFFVSIAYCCWACRRHSLKFSEEGVEFD